MPTANAFINELNLKDLIKDFNGVVIGASGGAMNMANNVYCIPEVYGEHKDKKFKRIIKGLNLTDINIIPHYQFFENLVFPDGTKMVKDILLPDSKIISMVALPDRSYIIQKGENTEFYGKMFLLKDGKISDFSKGNIFKSK